MLGWCKVALYSIVLLKTIISLKKTKVIVVLIKVDILIGFCLKQTYCMIRNEVKYKYFLFDMSFYTSINAQWIKSKLPSSCDREVCIDCVVGAS